MTKLNENAEVYENLQKKPKWHRKQDRKRLLKAAKKLFKGVDEFQDELINSGCNPTCLMIRDFDRLLSGLGPYRQAHSQVKEKYLAESYPENERGETVYENITLIRQYAE